MTSPASTHALRRQLARRAHIVGQRTRLKNQVHSTRKVDRLVEQVGLRGLSKDQVSRMCRLGV